MRAATFAAVFAALYAGHVVGDHWMQTDAQAGAKTLPGWAGRAECAFHVGVLTIALGSALLVLVPTLGLPLSSPHVIAGLALNAVSHWWADRRHTLAALADLARVGGFYRLGAPRAGHLLKGPTIGDKPIRVMADDNPCLGTGAYALDQAWHVGWLFVASLVIAVGTAPVGVGAA